MPRFSELNQTKVYQEARQEGKQEEKLATIARLLALGSTVEQIAPIVDLPVEDTHQMVQQLEN